jgi:hypothetical protein
LRSAELVSCPSVCRSPRSSASRLPAVLMQKPSAARAHATYVRRFPVKVRRAAARPDHRDGWLTRCNRMCEAHTRISCFISTTIYHENGPARPPCAVRGLRTARPIGRVRDERFRAARVRNAGPLYGFSL